MIPRRLTTPNTLAQWYNKAAMVQAIFFDIGDTLVFDDPPLRERFGMALREVGIAYSPRRLPEAFRAGEDSALAAYLNGIPWNDLAVLQQSAARIVEALGLTPLSQSRWNSIYAAFAAVPFLRRVHPQASALLEELQQQGFVLGAVSDWDETLPDLLNTWGLAPYFRSVAVSALVGVTKPNPALFETALRQARAVPKTSLYIGDWYALDVAGARAVGMRALLFDHAGRSPDADCARVQTFEEMRGFLLALPRPER